MGRIKNMGTGTMQFKEGIIVTGSSHNTNGTDSEYSLVVSGSELVVDNLIVDGRVGIGTSNPDYKLEVGGSMSVGEYIYHRNDTNTSIRFEDDKVTLAAGGYTGLVLDESTSGVDRIYLGGPSNDTASAKKYAQILFLSGGAGASANEANYSDTNFFVSGSVNSKNTSVRGTAAFGGDLQVSGTLYAGTFASDVNVKGSTSTIVAKGIVVGSNTDSSIERSSVSVRAHGSGNRGVKGVLRAFAGSSPSLTLGTETNVELKIQQNNNSKIVLDTNGRIGINKAMPTGDIHLGSITTFDDDIYALQDLHVTGSINLSSLALNTGFSVSAGNIYAQKTNANPGLVFIHSASNLTGNSDYTQNQTTFGEISFAGSNNSLNSLAIGASIAAITEGTWNIGSDRPTALVFKTTKTNTAVNTEVMRLDNTGFLGLGTKDPAFTFHVEATGSGVQPRIGIINRSNSIAADDQVGSLMFGAVENSDYDSTNRIVAQIDAIAEQNYDVAGTDGGLNFETSLAFKTVGFSDGLTNAMTVTGDNELQVDTITSLDSDVQTEKIQWRNDIVNMAVGNPAVCNQRIEVSGSIKYVEFAKSNVFIDGQERDVQAQPNRVHFNPDDATNFELRVGGNNNLGADQYFYVSGAINSKNTGTKGTAVFGGDLVTSGAMYFEELSITPSTVADGTVVLYGKDDSGVTKLYLKNESGETEIGNGGGGGTANKTVVYGSITLLKNGSRTVSFDRQTSIGGTVSSNVKSMLFAPFNGTVSKIMVMLKTNNNNPVTSTTHGTITAKIFKNANNYGSSAFSEDKVGDNFSEVNASNPGISKGTFFPNTSFNEGDLLQFTIERDDNGTSGNSEGIITIVLSES